MEGPGSTPPRRRAGDANNPYGAPSVRDWQRNTWYGPAPIDSNPFDEPDSAPELLELRSDNVKEKEGEFWQDQSATGYRPAVRTAGRTGTASAVKTGKKKRDRSKTVLWTVLGLLLAAAAAVCVLYFGVYTVREIRVEGNEWISSDDIIRFSGIQKGAPILGLDEKKIAESIQTHIDAKSKSNQNYTRLKFRYMERQMPGTVILTVRELEPCCWIDLRGIIYVMDKKLKVLFESENEQDTPANLVQVKGLEVRSGSHLGQTLSLKSAMQQRVFEELFLEMKVLGCTELIAELDLSNPNSVLMITRTGYTVNMGNCGSTDSSENRIHAKLRSLMLVNEELVRIGETGGSIDIRDPEEPRYSKGNT